MKIGESYVSLDAGYDAITFDSPTSVTIWWKRGLIGHYVGEAREVEILRIVAEVLSEHEQRHYENMRDKGVNYREVDRAVLDEHHKDYEAQCKALREQGIYAAGSPFDISGSYVLNITTDEGERRTTLTGRIEKSPVDAAQEKETQSR